MTGSPSPGDAGNGADPSRLRGAPDEVTALIADDEPLARRRVQQLLRGRDGVRVVGQRATGTDTLAAIRDLSPDLLFLDVQMPGLDGFEVLDALRPEERPVVVFSTAFDEYALAAFEVSAVDYLLKPYADDRFDEALRRALDRVRSETMAAWHRELERLLDGVRPGALAGAPDGGDGGALGDGERLDRFAVRTGERFDVVEAGQVDWIEADGDYVRLHAGSESHLLRATMAALERRLDPACFVRIHRSTIVQLDRVRQARPDEHGDWAVVLAGGRRLRVSRRYRDAVLRRLGIRD